MAKTTVKIEGLNSWRSGILNVPQKVATQVAREVRTSGQRVEAGAKRLAPVDTGRLRSSISNQLNLSGQLAEVFIYSNVEYAKHVEHGTSRQSAQPFLIPSFNSEVNQFNKNIENAVRGAFK